MVGDAERVSAVLRGAARRGLVVRVRAPDDEPSWELRHDNRCRAWPRRGSMPATMARRTGRPMTGALTPCAGRAPTRRACSLGRAARSRVAPHVRDRRARRRVAAPRTAEPVDTQRWIAQSRQRVRRQATASRCWSRSAVLRSPATPSYRSSPRRRSARSARPALRARNLGRFVLSLEAVRLATAEAPCRDLRRIRRSACDWQLQAWTDDGPGLAVRPARGTSSARRPRRDGAALVEDVETRGRIAALHDDPPRRG